MTHRAVAWSIVLGMLVVAWAAGCSDGAGDEDVGGSGVEVIGEIGGADGQLVDGIGLDAAGDVADGGSGDGGSLSDVDGGPGDVAETTADGGGETVPPEDVVEMAEESVEPYAFEEFPWLTEPPDPLVRICDEAADPAGAPDKVYITCAVEGEAPAGGPAEPKDELVVMAYNIERGHDMDAQVALLLEDSALPLPDLMLMSELDRGCSRTDFRYVAKEYAEALGMYYVFAVEFVELEEVDGVLTAQCEHGNAILSKYPLGNVVALRHTVNKSWYEDEGQPRLGGRIAVMADVRVGDAYLHVISVHFESSIEETERSAQALEIATLGLEYPLESVVGGDMNSGFLYFDLLFDGTMDETVSQFTTFGYVDAHAALAPDDRITAPDSKFILDLIVGTEDLFSTPGIGPEELCGGLSDHLPVWSTVTLPE